MIDQYSIFILHSSYCSCLVACTLVDLKSCQHNSMSVTVAALVHSHTAWHLVEPARFKGKSSDNCGIHVDIYPHLPTTFMVTGDISNYTLSRDIYKYETGCRYQHEPVGVGMELNKRVSTISCSPDALCPGTI